MSENNWPKVRRLMDKHLSEDDVQTIAFDLSIEYSNLSGNTKRGKIISLLRAVHQHNLHSELNSLLQTVNRIVNWPLLTPDHDINLLVNEQASITTTYKLFGLIPIWSVVTTVGIVLLIIFFNISVVIDSLGRPTEAALEYSPECSSDEVLCIGLVTGVGQIDDKSFNQSAWEGIQLAESELGAHIDFVETRDSNDYANSISLFVDANYDIIVTVGFALSEATAIAAAENPDIDFIGVDQFQVDTVSNLTGLVFNEDQAGYLAGVLAASLSESGTIAAVLGTDLVPPVVAFKEGFENGAEATNPDINIISTYHPGGLDVAFTDPEWGAITAAQAIDQGADVIFGAGGITGNSALIEAAGNEGLYCIGVDTDQWKTLPEARPCLVSSAMKLITPSVFDLVEASANEEFPSGNYFGDVGLASYYDFEDEISDESKDLIDETAAGLANGIIDTGYGP